MPHEILNAVGKAAIMNLGIIPPDQTPRLIAGSVLGYVPKPPSTNKLYKWKGGRMVKSDQYVAWSDEAGWVLKAQGLRQIRGEYGVILHVPLAAIIDIDNTIKATVDLVRQLHITDDDKHCGLVVVSHYDGPVGTFIIEIFEHQKGQEIEIIRRGAD